MRRPWSASLPLGSGFLLVLFMTLAPLTASATVPSGFAETRIVTGLDAPTTMAFAPDGRLAATCSEDRHAAGAAVRDHPGRLAR